MHEIYAISAETLLSIIKLDILKALLFSFQFSFDLLIMHCTLEMANLLKAHANEIISLDLLLALHSLIL